MSKYVLLSDIHGLNAYPKEVMDLLDKMEPRVLLAGKIRSRNVRLNWYPALLPNMATDYHKELGFPDVEYPTGTFAVEPSGHARSEADSDRYGGFRLPTKVNLTESMYERHPKQATGSEKGEKTLPHIFELTVEQGEVVKLGARTHYDDERDIVLILKPAAGVIVTAWINVKGDAHHTLNEEKYERVK